MGMRIRRHRNNGILWFVYIMKVCVSCVRERSLIPRFFAVAISLDPAIVIAVDVRSGGYVSFRME